MFPETLPLSNLRNGPEYGALNQLVGKSPARTPRRTDAKVLDAGDVSVVFAHVDPLWLRFSSPALEAAFLKDAFHSASVLHIGQSIFMLVLLLAQWALHLVRAEMRPNTPLWESAPNLVLYRIMIIITYITVRVVLDRWVPTEQANVYARRAFILVNIVPRTYMLIQWVVSILRIGWIASRSWMLPETHNDRLDSPAGAIMVLTVFFFPIMMQLHFCGPLVRMLTLLSATGSLLTPHSALQDDDSTASLLIVHVVASVAAHFLELTARVAYMRQAKLLVQMRQQVAADSKLNHLLKNKCAEARAEIEVVQDLADNPELISRLASVDALMEQTIQWTYRREVLLQLEKGIYTSQFRPSVLRDVFKSVCGGRHARAEIRIECAQTVEVDVALLKLLLEEGFSNAIKYRQPGTKLWLTASERIASKKADVQHESHKLHGSIRLPGLGSREDATSRLQTSKPEKADDVAWARGGEHSDRLELYVQLTNENRDNVRALTAEECARAFQPGVTLDKTSTAASTGVGLHTVMLGVASAGGQAWLSTSSSKATDGESARVMTTFHFTLPMRRHTEARKGRSFSQRGAAKKEAVAQDLRDAGVHAGAKRGSASETLRRRSKPSMLLEGLPFSKTNDRPATADNQSRHISGNAYRSTMGGSAPSSGRAPPCHRISPSASCTDSPKSNPFAFAPSSLHDGVHTQESRDVLADLQSLSVAGGSGTPSACPSAEAGRFFRGYPPTTHRLSSTSDDIGGSGLDSPTPSTFSEHVANSFSDVLMYALDDSAILRSYMLNVFKRMGAHPASRALGVDEEEVDSFINVALGLAPPFVPYGSVPPSSSASSPHASAGSGLAPRHSGPSSDFAPPSTQVQDSSSAAPHEQESSTTPIARGRMADVVVLDYYIECEDDHVVNGGEIADTLRERGFNGLIALFSGITRGEEAQILERGSIDVVIHKGSGPGHVQEQLTDAWFNHKRRRMEASSDAISDPNSIRQSPLVPYDLGSLGSPDMRANHGTGNDAGSRRAPGSENGIRPRSSKTRGLLGQSARWF